MKNANGSALRTDQVQSVRDYNQPGEQATALRWPQNPPAKEFKDGRVITRVWANPNHWGDITWRVDQLRIRYGTSTGSNVARSFHVEDLQDAMRGIYYAQRWIRKAERRRRWRFLPWNR